MPGSAISDECELVHFALMANVEPVNDKEALKSVVWKKAMIDELRSIKKNHTWELVASPEEEKDN